MIVSEMPPTMISGLILNYRTADRTASCALSMWKEGVRKIYVVDNSDDGGSSIEELKVQIEALVQAGLYVEIVHSGSNLGFSAGVNRGLEWISETDPSHVLLINSDAQVEPGSLIKMYKDLMAADIVVPRIAQSDSFPSSSFAYYDSTLALITSRPILNPIRHASGCCLLLHERCVRSIRFDEDFFFYGEDVMLGYENRKNGVLEIECSEAVVLHASSASAKNGSIFYEYHINRAHWLLAKKTSVGYAKYLISLCARIIALPLRASIRCIRFKSINAWKGFALATCDVVTGRLRSLTPQESCTLKARELDKSNSFNE